MNALVACLPSAPRVPEAFAKKDYNLRAPGMQDALFLNFTKLKGANIDELGAKVYDKGKEGDAYENRKDQ